MTTDTTKAGGAPAATHSATLLAWCRSDNDYGKRALSDDNPVEAVEAVIFHLQEGDDKARLDRWAANGYMLVGVADITLRLRPPEALAESQIATLRAQKQAVLAEAQNKATAIERQIQTLLAIDYAGAHQ